MKELEEAYIYSRRKHPRRKDNFILIYCNPNVNYTTVWNKYHRQTQGNHLIQFSSLLACVLSTLFIVSDLLRLQL